MTDDPGGVGAGGEEVEISEQRRRGLEKMSEVYGWDVSDGPGDFFGMTVEHLFGEVWTRDGLTQKERRILLLGLVIGVGLDDVIGLQLETALRLGELDPDELRDIVIFAAHYVGWPKGAKLNTQVEDLIAKSQR